jgi:hypothetical protein
VGFGQQKPYGAVCGSRMLMGKEVGREYAIGSGQYAINRQHKETKKRNEELICKAARDRQDTLRAHLE